MPPSVSHPESSEPPSDLLAAHAAWIRRLAHALVRDPDTAEELVQRTLLSVWRAPPRSAGSTRAWLARCVRNLATSTRRDARRRLHHEAAAARSEAQPSAHDLLERASLARDLAERVFALDEPYRATILRRYFDGLEPIDIARESGVPAATVRTRIARGLAQLREDLDRSTGGRRTWQALLLPLARPTPPTPRPFLPTTTVLLVNTKLKFLLPIVASLLAAAYFVTRPDAPISEAAITAREPVTGLEKELASSAGGSSTQRAVPPVERDDSSATVAKAARVETAAAPAKESRAHGWVLDSDGAPRARVKLGAFGPTAKEPLAETTSSGDGRFEFQGHVTASRIAAIDASLATVLSARHADLVDQGELVVVVAQAFALAGTVVDETSSPLLGASVAVATPAGFRARFAQPLDRSSFEDFKVVSAANGAFDFQRLPLIEGARLVASFDGFENANLDLAQVQPGIVIALQRIASKDGVLAGRVVDPTGAAVEGAHVAFGVDTMRSAADGSFHFKIVDKEGMNARFGVVPKQLRAVKKGLMPAEYAPSGAGTDTRWPAFVELKLGGKALSIEGHVVDHLGQRRAGVNVWIADTTTFGAVGEAPAQLESLMAGDSKRLWRVIETAEDGGFVIDGLCDREYTVEAMEPETLLRAREPRVRAGSTGVLIAMPKDALFPRVAGRVSSHDGKPIAGATIHPMCDAFCAQLDGQTVSTSHAGLDAVTTDAGGRFEFLDVPKSLVYLRVDGETILPLEYGRYVEGDARFTNARVKSLEAASIEKLDIVVDVRAHLQIELTNPTSADEFALLDELGHAIELSEFEAGGRREGDSLPIEQGRTSVIGGSDRGTVVVLKKSGVEVARLPVKLVPGATTLVRY